MIQLCKKLCQSAKPYAPIIGTVSSSGHAIVCGMSYQTSLTPNYAMFMFLAIGSAGFYTVQCYNKTWTVQYVAMNAI